MAINFTDESVKEYIESGKPVVVDFWATWCGPCKRVAPIVEELAAEYEDRVIIGKYNVEDNDDLAVENGIQSIPAFLFFKGGKQLTELRLNGSQTKDKLQAQIEKLLS